MRHCALSSPVKTRVWREGCHLQVCSARIEETFSDLELLNCDIQVVAIGELVGRRGNTGTVLHPGRWKGGRGGGRVEGKEKKWGRCKRERGEGERRKWRERVHDSEGGGEREGCKREGI